MTNLGPYAILLPYVNMAVSIGEVLTFEIDKLNEQAALPIL